MNTKYIYDFIQKINLYIPSIEDVMYVDADFEGMDELFAKEISEQFIVKIKNLELLDWNIDNPILSIVANTNLYETIAIGSIQFLNKPHINDETIDFALECENYLSIDKNSDEILYIDTETNEIEEKCAKTSTHFVEVLIYYSNLFKELKYKKAKKNLENEVHKLAKIAGGNIYKDFYESLLKKASL